MCFWLYVVVTYFHILSVILQVGTSAQAQFQHVPRGIGEQGLPECAYLVGELPLPISRETEWHWISRTLPL